MAAVTLVKRVSGKGYMVSLTEGTDAGTLSDVERTTSGAANLWADANTTAIVIGGGAAQTSTTLGKSGETVTVLGDLVVAGTTTSVDSETVNIADNHLYLNKGYETVSAQSGGVVVNYLPTSTNDTVAGAGFTDGITVITTGSATFAAGEFIQIEGANTVGNDGLYEVLSHSGTSLVIDSSPTHSFVQAGFTADSTVAGTIRKVTVSVLQAGTDGDWSVGRGDNLTAMTNSLRAIAFGDQDNLPNTHYYLNSDYTTAAALTGGLAVNYLPTATVDTFGGSGFTSGSTVTTAGSATFAAGDFVQITGANLPNNDGVYEVTSHSGTTLTIDSSPVHQFVATGFDNDTDTSGAITKVNVSVIQSKTDGDWQVGKGATQAALTSSLTDLSTGAGTTTLDQAYGNGNTITMTDADGDFDISVTSGTPAISLDAAGASNFTVAGAGLTLATTTSGTLAVSSAGTVDVDGVAVQINGTGASNLTTTAAALTVSTVTSGTLAVTSAGALDMDGTTVTLDGTSVSIDATTGSNMTVTGSGEALTLEAAGGGANQVHVNSAGTDTDAIDINATAGGVAIDGLTGVSIDATNATTANFSLARAVATSNATMTISVNNTAATSGDGTMNLTSASANGTGAINLDADDTVALNVLASGTVSIGTDAVAQTVTIGSASATAVTLDAATFSLDASAASNVTVSGASADLTLGGRGATITLNESGDTTLSGFTNTSVVGALNELKAEIASSSTVVFAMTAQAAVNEGSLLYQTTTASNVNKADATTGTAQAADAFIGVAEGSAGAAASVNVVISGPATVEVDAATYAAGDEIFMSAATAGRATNVAPSTAGNMIQSVGWAISDVGVKTAGQTIEVMLVNGSKSIV